jgi:hydrogenase-4 component F
MFQSEFTILRSAFAGQHVVAAILFVLFLVAIFSGFLVHISRMVLGPDPGYERAELGVYKKYSLIALSSVVLILGFWIPSPLFTLIQKAAALIVEVR